MYGISDTAYGATSDPAKAPTFTPALIRLSAVVILGVMMTILDTTIVNVAIRTLGRDFQPRSRRSSGSPPGTCWRSRW